MSLLCDCRTPTPIMRNHDPVQKTWECAGCRGRIDLIKILEAKGWKEELYELPG